MAEIDFMALNNLAMNYNPAPILNSINEMGNTMRTFGAGGTAGLGSLLMPQSTPTTPGTPGGGAIDPKLLASLLSPGNKQQAPSPHFMPGAAVPKGAQVQMAAIPALPAPNQEVPIPTLAALLQGTTQRR